MNIKFSQKHKKQFKKMGILAIYLFGSQVHGKTTPISDVDIGIIFDKPEKYKDNTMDVYLKLYDIFTDILPKKYLHERFKLRAHEFDLVFLQFAPVALQFEATRGGKVLYEKDRKKRFTYEEEVMIRKCDLKHFHYLRHKAILERI